MVLPVTPTTPPAIDFAGIRSRCPRAFAALITWFCQDKAFQYTPTSKSPGPETIFPGTPGAWIDTKGGLSMGDTRYSYELNPRDLFDFFDEQGVYVTMRTVGFRYVPQFRGEIECMGGSRETPVHPTRPAAEAAAFGAGFEKLEEMLGKEKEG